MAARQRVPVNVITGPLGVGKTTAISRLLAGRPAGEHWAVLVNKFGAVGIDGAALESSCDVTVREISGVCMCCSSTAVLVPSVAQLLRRARPRRLLVEPSGLGHPGGLLDAFSGQYLAPSLEIQATICLVDARLFGEAPPDAALLELPAFVNMVTVADVLVAAKPDLSSPEELAAFVRWGKALSPPKRHVATELSAELLNLSASP